MKALSSHSAIGPAWVAGLAAAASAPGGRLLHLVLTVESPGLPDERLVEINDEILLPAHHSVSTVASTVFPSSTYADPEITFEPGMPTEEKAILDTAACDLYDRYRQMLPYIQTFDGNSHGTYFGRLVSWPGKDGDGYNQLKVRIRQLRRQRELGRSAMNAADMVVEGFAEQHSEEAGLGMQTYKSDDERLEAFPCLVHLDISVVNSQLSLLAVYRHWHMITKAYGNLIGLTRLQHFLAQQSGYQIGELVVHGTVANAQFDSFNIRSVRRLIDRLQAVTSG